MALLVNKNGICFNPDPVAFNVFVAHVKEAEEFQRRGALNDAFCEAYEAMRDLVSPALRAARCELMDLPSAPDDLLGGIPGVPGNSRTASVHPK